MTAVTIDCAKIKPLAEGLAIYCNETVRLIPLEDEHAKRAFEAVKLINSPHTVQHLGITTENGGRFFGVVKHIKETLEEFGCNNPNRSLTKIKICWDIAKGLCWMHNLSPPVFHGDFQSCNVFINSKWRPKIANFMFRGSKEEDTQNFKDAAIELISNSGNETDEDGRDILSTERYRQETLQLLENETDLPQIRDGLLRIHLSIFYGESATMVIGQRIWEKLVSFSCITPKDVEMQILEIQRETIDDRERVDLISAVYSRHLIPASGIVAEIFAILRFDPSLLSRSISSDEIVSEILNILTGPLHHFQQIRSELDETSTAYDIAVKFSKTAIGCRNQLNAERSNLVTPRNFVLEVLDILCEKHHKNLRAEFIAKSCAELLIPPERKYVFVEEFKFFLDLFGSTDQLFDRVLCFLQLKGFFGFLSDYQSRALMGDQTYVIRISNTNPKQFSVYFAKDQIPSKILLQHREPDQMRIEDEIRRNLSDSNLTLRPVESKFNDKARMF